MTTAKQSLTEFYEARGQIRFMMIMSKERKAELSRIRKIYGVSHGAMLEIFLDLYPAISESFKEAFEEAAKDRREDKKSRRASAPAFAVGKKLKGLSKEQLQVLEEMIDEQMAKEVRPGPGESGSPWRGVLP